MKFLSDILAKAGLTVDGVVTLNNTATGQTPNANDNSTKLATTAWVRTFVQPYSLPIATSSVLGGIKVGTGLSIDAGTGVLSVSGGGAASIKSTQTFTATAGQTVFTISGGYIVGLIDVFLNGVYLSPNQTTATNGSTITLGDAALAGDIIDVIIASPVYQGATTTTDQLSEGSTNLYFTNARARAAISESVTGLDYNSATGVLSITTGYGIPTTASQTTWDAAYNDKINSAAVTGTTTKTLTLTQQDGGTITASWTDDNTDAVTSVFGRTGAVVAVSGDYTTALVTEVTNLYYTDARARAAISVTGSGSYDSATGIITVTGGVTSVNTLTGAVTLTTTNIGEGTNLYYTTARANSDFDTRLATKSTTNLAEGTNLYYTTARANSDFDTRLATKSTTNLAEGTNLYYTDTRVGTYLTSNSYATQSYVSTQINNLVSGAPGLLDTLDELAAALGDDPNFATTVTTALGNRLRIDTASQGLTGTQQGYGRTNLGLGSLSTLSSIGDTYITDLAYSKLTGVPSTFAPSAHTHDDRYYTETEIGNFFSGASVITGYNKTNWDTAYGWGNHASGGYLTTASAASTYVSLSGSYANPAWITSLAYSKITGVPAFITSYTEVDTLATVTGRGATTSTALTLSGGATVTGLTIAKSAGISTITFPAGTNDPAFISHTESTANVGIMRFSVGDDNDTIDYFVFGNTVNPDAFRINANGTISIGTWQGTAIADSYISSAATWNAKQAALSGTGFVKITGTTISYDNSTYLTTAGTAANSTLWNGLSTPSGYTSTGTVDKLAGGLSGLGDIVWLSQARVQTFLGLGSLAYSSATIPTNNNQLTNGAGYITSYTETDTLNSVTGRGASTANMITLTGKLRMQSDLGLDAGYTLYFGREESFGGGDTGGTDYGYITFDNNSSTYGTAAGETSVLRIGSQNDGDGSVGDHIAVEAAGNIYLRPASWGGSGAVRVGTLASYSTVWHSGNLTNLNQLTNGPGYITGYTETDTLASVTGRGATTTAAITVTASEGREVAVYMASSYNTDDLVSGHEYGWYNDHWRLGMTRSGGAAGADFVIQWNAARRLSLTSGGNLTVTGTISASNLSGTNTGDQTNISGNAATAGSSNFLSLQGTSNLRTVTSAGIYRQEEPDSGFSYTTTLNMNSSDGRQQLTIERGGGGMKFRGSTSGSGDVSWSDWRTILHSSNYSSYALPLTGGTLSGGLNGTTASFTGNLTVSSGNTTGGGIILADDGDIVDLNDAYLSLRFSSGVRVFSANRGGSAVITLANTGAITATGNVTGANLSGTNTGDQTTITGNAGSATLLKSINTTTSALSNWNPQSLTYQAWGQAWTHSSIGGDSGDMVLWLRAGQYSAGGTEVCMMIDGDYYAGSGAQKVWHAGNLTNLNQLSNGPGYITSSGSISGTSSNITAYTINQSVGTGNSPTFSGLSISNNLTVGANLTTSTFRIGSNYGVRYFSFNPGNVANQKADLYFNGWFWGNIEIEATTSYNYANRPGSVIKRYYLGLSPSGGVYANESKVLDNGGNTADGITFGDVTFDSANNRWKIVVASRDGANNGYTIKVTCFVADGTSQSYVMDSMGITSNYTEGTTYPYPYEYFNKNVGFGGKTNPSCSIDTSGSLSVSGDSNFGPDSGGDTGIRIRYGNSGAGYGRIRFHQDGTNHNTIHSFSASWQGGSFLGASAGALNIAGQYGVTFGGWNIPDAHISTDGIYVKAWATPSGGKAWNANSVLRLQQGSTGNDVYIEMRNRADVGDHAAILFTDNNVGGYIGFRTYASNNVAAGSDCMIYGTYNDHIFQNGSSETFNGKTETFRIYANGSVRATGDVTAYSDKRVKENIITIDKALEKTLQLRGVFYNRTDKDDKSQKVGVIAQEIQEILPQVVNEDYNGLLSVSYGNITGLLIEAVKEQQTQIESQKSEIDELKDLVQQLINR